MRELLEDIVDQAIRRTEESLSQRLPEVLAVMLHEQALAVSESVRREIKATVRQSVAAVLAERLPNLRIQQPNDDASTTSPNGGWP